ncbi:UDP-N-acetylmuramoyl-L-alanine--D-glutamate ligase [Corynebacterium flavescens]|uniref:UDP-N-acetylmuramoyl-L-alanine--D-glutamate ligase n=1 Tax=Corynebacterium flavescens TaxID=28028 RepID=UPI003FD4A83F
MDIYDASRVPASLRGKVLVAGAGVSGRGCVRVLHELGIDTTVADGSADARQSMEAQFGVDTLSPAEALQATGDFDLVVTSPGWRPDTPLLVGFAQADREVIGDVELAYRLDRAGVFGAPRKWLVVTGTNGKTTTTGMLAQIMQVDAQRTGRRALAVGNIGTSPFDALRATPRVEVLAVELSSFQLHWSSQLRPAVGVLLNLAEDHIDWHGSFDAYARAKAKVLAGQVAVYGRDDSRVCHNVELAKEHGQLASHLYSFGAGEPGPGQVGIAGQALVAEDLETPGRVKLGPIEGIEPPGRAGALDAAAAAAVAALAGAAPESIDQGLHAFTVAGHRGAIVHRHAGVDFIDNSKATNPHAADAALRGLDSVVWVAGGQLKGADVHRLIASHAGQIKAAVVLGIDRHLIAQALQELAPHVPVEVIDSTDPQEAMDAAVSFALHYAVAGDTVLLAPAAASLDMYSGMGERGDMFAHAARRLDH